MYFIWYILIGVLLTAQFCQQTSQWILSLSDTFGISFMNDFKLVRTDDPQTPAFDVSDDDSVNADDADVDVEIPALTTFSRVV